MLIGHPDRTSNSYFQMQVEPTPLDSNTTYFDPVELVPQDLWFSHIFHVYKVCELTETLCTHHPAVSLGTFQLSFCFESFFKAFSRMV